MNLTSKFVLWSSILLAILLAFGGVTVWHLEHLRRAAVATAAEYDAMDRADAAVNQIIWLRDSLRGADGRTYRDAKFFAPIRTEVVEIVRELRMAAGLEDGSGEAELTHGLSAAAHLEEAARHSTPDGKVPAADDKAGAAAPALAAAAELEKVRQSLLAVTRLVPASARHHVTGAADRLLRRLVWTCVSLLLIVLISAAIHWLEYRSMVRPLLWLRDDMKRSAATDYRQPVRARGDREYVDVAGFFNGVVRDLAALYHDLEQKVIARSRELVRSERLASVGYLAAGVAHEINNPLSVISGYAELAGKGLRRVMTGSGAADGSPQDAEAEAEALAGALEAQSIIRDEAFRCKEITNRLLSLARGGGDGREALNLDEVARQVTVLTRGLRNYRDRRVTLNFDQGVALEVVANPTEMKQVLLNLTVNALEAVPPERGEVRIGGRRRGEWVELSVEDNGKGMTPHTLDQVFEPFFTAKRGAGEPGTGLGLSITHAIVENHGGRIRAESDGPGRGSRFIVSLPAITRALAAAGGGTLAPAH